MGREVIKNEDMEPIDNFIEAMQLMFRRDGYIACWADREYPVGSIYPDAFNTGFPLRVVGRCAIEDALRQLGYSKEVVGAGESLVQPPSGGFWHKCVVAD